MTGENDSFSIKKDSLPEQNSTRLLHSEKGGTDNHLARKI